ncbi:MAG TPA: response regulator [Arenibaculum sp.]|nr:response regulator [Arenibaculum sp.]
METQADHLKAHLPFLRRYARALTGSTEAGDGLVTRAVETALGDPARFRLEKEATTDNRLPLYTLLNHLAGDGRQHEPDESRHPIERALTRLPETERRLFLLVSLEELSTAHAAAVMELGQGAANDALTKAQEAVREQLVANILIVEDDAIIAYDLSETVLAMGHKVAGTAATMEEALETAARTRPSLALMDLRLAHGGSGITTAQALREHSALPVIFVTAFAEELRRRGLDHLGPVIRKPFTREQIERAITQAVFTPQPKAARPD